MKAEVHFSTPSELFDNMIACMGKYEHVGKTVICVYVFLHKYTHIDEEEDCIFTVLFILYTLIQHTHTQIMYLCGHTVTTCEYFVMGERLSSSHCFQTQAVTAFKNSRNRC